MSDDKLIEYRDTFLKRISDNAYGAQDLKPHSFYAQCIELIDEESTLDTTILDYHKSQQGISIYAYCYTENDGILSLFIFKFFDQEDWSKPIPRGEVLKFVERSLRFVEKCEVDSFISGLEESRSEVPASANHIKRLLKTGSIEQIIVHFFTDGLLSEQTKDYSVDPIFNIPVRVKPYDIRRFESIEDSEVGFEEFTVNFEEFGDGISALQANETGLQSFLAVMPADILSQVYRTHTQKLLDSNVRTFLDFRGKVNKGIKSTLRDEPDKFFAYNNGLTVTATDIELSDIGSKGAIKIKSLKNMQIVNGGQTTCAIFFSPRERGGEDIDLSKVFVPMKLTIINAGDNISDESIEEAEVFKSKVSEYANSQNAVNQGDLQSNHEFHIRLHNHSKNILAPHNQEGMQTYWYYERTRGQWATSRRIANHPRAFERKFPKKQIFTKTDMAKYENTWRMRPFDVSKGAQKNLLELYKVIKVEFQKNENQFRQQFFKSIVAKKILFNSTEKIVSKSSWYISETYTRPFIVTYTIAYIRNALQQKGKDLNLNNIYEAQEISASLGNEIDATGEFIFNLFDSPVIRNNTSYREWAVKETSWEVIKNKSHTLKLLDNKDILTNEQQEDQRDSDVQDGIIGEELELLQDFFKVDRELWKQLMSFQIQQGYKIGEKQIDIPKLAFDVNLTGKTLSDRQLKELQKILIKAEDSGFYYRK
jgi:hypothetical protein